MWFFRDIMLPIVIAVLAFVLIVYILNLILRFFSLDIPILRFVVFFSIWYYLGPIMYSWLIDKIIVIPKEGIKILYMPVQAIISAIEKLV